MSSDDPGYNPEDPFDEDLTGRDPFEERSEEDPYGRGVNPYTDPVEPDARGSGEGGDPLTGLSGVEEPIDPDLVDDDSDEEADPRTMLPAAEVTIEPSERDELDEGVDSAEPGEGTATDPPRPVTGDRGEAGDDQAYREAVDGLYARQPSRLATGLERINLLCDLLGRPDQAFPSIQITGTNGKGSVAAMATTLLAGLGLKAGTYTSPHLQQLRERIRVAGRAISPAEFAKSVAYLEPFLSEVDARGPQSATFFEALTALSFSVFADTPVEVGVVEVGMGGSWDATNVVRGEVCVIGRVTVDHPELGANPLEIAGEKVGAIKPGAVVVSAEQQPDVDAVIERTVSEAGGQLVRAGTDFGWESRRLAVGGQQVTLRGLTGVVSDCYVPLHGAHQATNAALALAAVESFLGFAGGIDGDVVRESLAEVRVPGRIEVVRRPGEATLVLDGAHNPSAGRVLADTLGEEFEVRERVLVVGMLADKDCAGFFAALGDVCDRLIVCEPPSPRALDADELAAYAESAGLAPEVVAGDMSDVLSAAGETAGEEDAVVVTGSLVTVGAARDTLGLEPV